MNQSDHATILEHLIDLRRVVFYSLGLIIGASVVVHQFREPVIEFLLSPLGEAARPLQFLTPLEPLLFILKVDFTLGFLVVSPVVVLLIWQFMAPGIRSVPSWKVYTCIFVTTILTLIGAGYAYTIVIPIVLAFMQALVITDTVTSFTAHGYLNFLLSTTTLLILIFQIPLVIVLITSLGLVRPEQIAARRSYLYIGILIASAMITPTTDILTLALVTLPAIVVTELGIQVSKVLVRRKRRPETTEPETENQ